jgi:hypothetical protein
VLLKHDFDVAAGGRAFASEYWLSHKRWPHTLAARNSNRAFTLDDKCYSDIAASDLFGLEHR